MQRRGVARTRPPPSMIARVLIRGDGVAAACCAHLLSRAGFQIRLEPAGRPRVPSILLSQAALALIRDVFDRPELLADRPRTERRVVAWTPGAEPVAMPHAATVAHEGALLDLLAPAGLQGFDGPPDFTIETSKPPVGGPRRFGARQAVAAEVRIARPEDRSTCWAEGLDEGWLFLAPNPSGPSWLLAVGAAPDRLLAQSRLIGPRTRPTGATSPAFDVCPRVADTLVGERWVACGTAAIAFDPICGDGVAQAVRESVLAAGVIQAMRAGEDAAALLGHYRAMLIAAMRRHLKLCADYYAANTGAWWSAETQALVDGYAWCTAKLAAEPEPRFVLQGFTLARRETAA